MTIKTTYDPSLSVEITDELSTTDGSKLFVTIDLGASFPYKYSFKDYDNAITFFSHLVKMIEMVKQCGKKT
ncbi:MAG: hypothetical protein J6X70_00140 [Muribaculaceae bacterium]|nr:hypothetical protein [Muribaculaceae bacterium]